MSFFYGIKNKKDYYLKRLREKGLVFCLGKLTAKFALTLISWTLGCLFFPFFFLMRLRFIRMTERAIGHLCIEPDCYIKEGILGLRPAYTTIMLAPPEKISNRYLLTYWKKYLKVITSPAICFLLKPFELNSLTCYKTYDFAYSPARAAAPEIQKKFAGRAALLSLTAEDRARGWEVLKKWGMTQDSWFICAHCREDGFLGDIGQSNRNATIANYFPAMDMVVEKGGWIVRMGDPSMSMIPAMKNVIDYAHTDIKCDWMDVFLAGSCRFFLGSDSGLYHLAGVFGVPAAIANYSHMSGALPYGTRDLGIPKLIWSEKEKRYLSFREILDSDISCFLQDKNFEDAGLKAVENSGEDIRDLAHEMLGRLEGRWQTTEEDERLQESFKSLMKPTHYSYGAASRIGRDFLRKYSFLLT